MYYTRMHSYMYYYIGNPVCICPMKKRKTKNNTKAQKLNAKLSFELSGHTAETMLYNRSALGIKS